MSEHERCGAERVDLAAKVDALLAAAATAPADQTRADVVLTEAEREAGESHTGAIRFTVRDVERIIADRLAARDAEHAAEVEALRWAELLTHQECAAKKHPDWYIDSEHNIVCPWCRAEAAEATVARVRDALDCPHGTHTYDTDATCRWCGLPSWVEALIRAALDGER